MRRLLGRSLVAACAAAAIVAGLVGAGTAAAAIAPPYDGLGDSLFSRGGLVVIDPMPAEAQFRSELWLVSPEVRFIASNERDGRGDPVQAPVTIGPYPAGAELIFEIRVEGTSTWQTGPGARNGDGEPHAVVAPEGDDYLVGFEDIRVARDETGAYLPTVDFNDNVFEFSGSISPAPGGSFTCRAMALKAPVLGQQAVANPSNDPCASGEETILAASRSGLLGLLSLNVGHAKTIEAPRAATSSTEAARVALNVGGVNIVIEGAESTARAACGPGGVALTGTAKIAKIKVNGTSLTVRNPLTINLGIGQLHLNRVRTVGGEAISQALALDLPGTALDLVIAESRAGSSGNPC